MTVPGISDDRPTEIERLPKWQAHGLWLAAEYGGCTCAGTDYGHESGCGWEPFLRLDDEQSAAQLAADHNELVAEVRRQRQIIEAVQWWVKDRRCYHSVTAETCPDCLARNVRRALSVPVDPANTCYDAEITRVKPPVDQLEEGKPL